MADILTIATSKRRPGQGDVGSDNRYPRVDYLELGRLLDTDVLDYDVYDTVFFGRSFRFLETQLRSDLYLALLGYWASRRYRVVFSLSERAGIPYAGFNRLQIGRRPFVNLFQSWSHRQEKAITKLNLLRNMDSILVLCQSMKEQMVKLGAAPDKVHKINYSVDQKFFVPSTKINQEPGLIVSIGEVRTRDYGMLFEAVRGLSAEVIVIAAGMWSAREKNSRLNDPQIPSNTRLSKRLAPIQLRELYAKAQFVVLPIYDTVSWAGATVTLEAASMGRAVIAPRSRGLSDFIIDGETGVLVEPGNAQALRAAIERLLANPQEARRLGGNARQRVDEELNLDTYVKRLAGVLSKYL